jgi:ABC-type uncharacterized transport system substrate-binding protein
LDHPQKRRAEQYPNNKIQKRSGQRQSLEHRPRERHMKVDVIVARSTPVVQAVKKTTTTIPVVISVPDAVGSGLVTSLAQPGGNITGTSSIMPELAGKRLELLREIFPKLSRVAFLAHGAIRRIPGLSRSSRTRLRAPGFKFSRWW